MHFEPDTRPAMRVDTISGVAFTRDGSTVAANYMRVMLPTCFLFVWMSRVFFCVWQSCA